MQRIIHKVHLAQTRLSQTKIKIQIAVIKILLRMSYYYFNIFDMVWLKTEVCKVSEKKRKNGRRFFVHVLSALTVDAEAVCIYMSNG